MTTRTMNRGAIETATGLQPDADTDHEDARDWYAAYGWHLSTEHAGDVCHDAVEYDWLDDDDETATAKLLAADDALTEDEAMAVVERARTIREAGESIESLLDAAVDAYHAGDIEKCREALLECYSVESEHGDTPAASALAGELLVIDEDIPDALAMEATEAAEAAANEEAGITDTERRPFGATREAYEWAADQQGYQGTYEDWLALPESERAEYEDGAAGVGTV